MYFSSVPRCTVFGEAYESRAAHGNKKAAEQATEGVWGFPSLKLTYGWWLKSGDHPFTGIHTSRVGAGFQPTVITWKMVGYDPLLLGMASWGGHKKIIPWIFKRNYLDPRIFSKLENDFGCSPDWDLCFPSTTRQPRASKGFVSFGTVTLAAFPRPKKKPTSK